MVTIGKIAPQPERNNHDSDKEWNKAKAEYREFVEQKVYKGELKPRATRVYFALKSFSDSDYKPAWPSIQTLVNETGMARQSVVTGIKELVEAEIITIQQQSSPRGGRPRNIYRFNVSKFRDGQPRSTVVDLPKSTTVDLPKSTLVDQNSVQQNPVRQNPVQQQHPASSSAPATSPNHSDLVVVLSEFFSEKDAATIASWPEIEKFSPEYIREKAALTTAKDRDNPLGFMRQALRENYKYTVPAAERRRAAREQREARERAEQLARFREQQHLESQRLKAKALLRQLTDTERSEIEAEARQILAKEGTTEHNPCYSARLRAECESIALRRAL